MAPVGFSVAETLFEGLKRKCVDDVADELAEFSLSSPARKIRRLDAFVPPITIDKGSESGTGSTLGDYPLELETDVIENKPFVPSNEERALVLYKPMNTSPAVSFQVDNNFIAQLKESWSGRIREKATFGSNSEEAGTCLAVVPWTASRFPSGSSANAGMQDEQIHPIEAESNAEDEPMSMDVEEENVVTNGSQTNSVSSGGGLQQWQQHCMDAHPVVNASAPVMWSW